MDYTVIDDSAIELGHLQLTTDELFQAVHRTNSNFEKTYERTRIMQLDVFEIIDFRMLSGLIGETFVTVLASISGQLEQNPNIDGYPDLLQVSTKEMKQYFEGCAAEDFISYKYGGFEVKNSFGTKKSGSFLLKGDQRIRHINSKLDWKAHHRETNHLIALFTDYINKRPRIAALFYSDTLEPDDWAVKQQPKAGSTMTSFSVVKTSGFNKLKSGIRLCLDDQEYIDFCCP